MWFLAHLFTNELLVHYKFILREISFQIVVKIDVLFFALLT